MTGMKQMDSMKSQGHRRQQGMVLVVSLVVLIVLFIVALAGLQSTIFQEKIASNTSQTALALQSADTTLREAEEQLEAMTDTAIFDNSNGYYKVGDAPNPFVDGTWTGSNSIVSGISYEGGVIPPRYFIEMLGVFGEGGENINITNYGYTDARGAGQVTVFRIVARGTGSSGKAQVIVESFYGKAF